LPSSNVWLIVLIVILSLLVLALILIALVAFLARKAWHMVFDRPYPRPLVDRSPKNINQDTLFGRGQNWFYTNRLDFLDLSVTAYDGIKLAGYYRPAERRDSKKLVILLHGYKDVASGMGVFAQVYLQKCDCHILIPHMRAHGMSYGAYTGYGLAESQDLISWIRYMQKILGKDLRIICHGRSMGAATVLLAAGSGRLPPEVKGVVADSSFTSLFALVRHMMRKRYHVAPRFFIREISRVAGRHIEYRPEKVSPIARADRISIPVLLIHGAEDSVIPPAHSEELYQRIRSPKRLLYVEGADHVETYDIAPSAYSTEIDRLLEVSGFFM